MILKILGVLLVVFGVFFFVKFPAIGQHQKESMTKAALAISGVSIIIGLIMIVLG